MVLLVFQHFTTGSFNSERVDIKVMVCNKGGSNFRDGDEMLK